MVELSKLPGHNYASACSGYLDGIFESYVKQYGNNLPNRPVAFPDAVAPNPDVNTDYNTPQIQNPYKVQPPKWQQEINERSRELQELQSQNGTGNQHLTKTKFPATYADLSFSQRMANDAAGLEPFKDLKAYRELNAKTAEEWCSDSEHKNSSECWNWRCGENGKDFNKSECAEYRCSKNDYYAQHVQECELLKLCSKNRNSDECMQYRCHDTDDKNNNDCKKWLCEHDGTYSAGHNTECMEFSCDINNLSGATNACKTYLCGTIGEDGTISGGSYSTHPNCIQYFCDTNKNYKNANPDKCTSNQNPTPE